MAMTEYQQTWDDAKWRDWQRQKDDNMVNEYMAVIDTRIDRVVLGWRMTDAILDGIMKGKRLDWHERIDLNRTVDEAMEHNHRADDLQQMIENIRCGETFRIPAERDSGIGFGPYDANDDKYLSMVLDYAGEMYADEHTGDTEWGEYVQRFYRCLLGTDDRGFRTLVIYDHEVEAVAAFQNIEAAYDNWAAQQEED
jgi:hypothetical protein